ncbi:DNA replication terminus site-binding protein [Kistimonas asteriae]|uniref:DNA replication terminus site-binding protein n=1 Tax=Kistimonas asteriae TaxID=517724 RepID=UPI001BA6973C|nr:hypothetical protein [Kistimonas asteriae]
MSNIKTAARLAVRDTVLSLIDHARLFCDAVTHDSDLPAWIMKQDHQPSVSAREKAAHDATSLTYQDDQQRQQTVKLTGLIGISSNTLELGHSFNRSKADFKAAMLYYRQLFGESIKMTDFSSKELRDGLLGHLKIQHLHFVQCYRQVKLFEEAPARIGFSWASGTHGTVRLTAETAIQHLKDKFTPSQVIISDIKQLEQMPKEAVVVIKRPLTPHLRANLSWPDNIETLRRSDKTLRTQYPGQINTPLPVFILLSPGQPLPEFNAIKPWVAGMKQDRLQRRDTCLEKLSDHPGSFLYIPRQKEATT